MMTDKESKSCTPVKEIEVLKTALNKDNDNVIEDESEVVKTDEVRRFVRERIPTGKMLTYQKEESQKAERKLMQAYEKWKAEVRKAREQLKTDISDTQLATLRHIGKGKRWCDECIHESSKLRYSIY